MSDEIEPYVLYRLNRGTLECAFWQLQGGQNALAMFLTGDGALTYRKDAGLDDRWQALRPTRPALLEILRGCRSAGVGYAVLDPDRERAKRVFDVNAILAAAESAGES